MPVATKIRTVKKTRDRKTFPFLLALAAALAVAGILAIGGFSFAATQEAHDSFCASCHTQPESTFYQRALDAQPVDLAAFHKNTKATRCIDCHSGAGIPGRMQAEMLGAGNAAKWYSGTAVQPAQLLYPIRDENCLKCHAEVTNSRRQNNHFHYFLARWQAQDPGAATCVTCHVSHATDGTAQTAFMSNARVNGVCQACHNILGRD